MLSYISLVLLVLSGILAALLHIFREEGLPGWTAHKIVMRLAVTTFLGGVILAFMASNVTVLIGGLLIGLVLFLLISQFITVRLMSRR
ncbi:MAG: hypothetical protein UU80_C0001G0030 [candidate division WWE3 bacterium GW2011_GWA1_41_8]|uniref:Uncharacterized protein n=3 Tax=Katanobacteria TaxID=422282 RepID=A0A0G0XDD6_UNCKA|nr:MAG: hypothetical protein UU72_C0001G0084 [candidate division WWE3 bacterium GW2011_GWB1_41_6]KKS22865.1 MAG: hypothetical protein UU80_C0001G0030 [candidate division WWE3 bacterium GW2011_GWA1_41_8]OGC56528.1 MAG: hypothetical protein A2976_02930 [candidate division WWE3 bacterium RIFCSPLOWO2_01_FULL_41_9]